MAAPTGFSQFIGSSLLMHGVGDLAGVLESVITGNPINLENYIKNKGIQIAITVITASLGEISGLIQVNNQADLITELRNAVIKDAVVRLGGTALTRIGNHVMKKNTGDLKRSIEKEVATFIAEHEAELQTICASAAYNAGKSSCDADTYNNILIEASKLIAKHVKTYHGEPQTIAKGVASGLLGLKFSGGNNPFTWASYGAAAALDAGIGLVEATTSTDYVLDRLDASVQTLFTNSLSPKTIFQQKLQSSYSSDATSILEIVSPAVFNLAQNQLNCNQIDKTNLASFEPRRAGIKSICDDVANLLQPTTSQTAKNHLKTSLTTSLLNRMRGILSTDFIQPTANFLASGAAHKINKQINEHIARMKIIEEAQRRLEQTANDENNLGNVPPLDREKIKEATDELNKLEDDINSDLQNDNSLSDEKRQKLNEFKEEIGEVNKKLQQNLEETPYSATIDESGNQYIKESNKLSLDTLKLAAKGARIILKYAEIYPKAVTAINIISKIGAGWAGLILAAGKEAIGWVAGDALGKVIPINGMVEGGAAWLQGKVPSLSNEDALSISAAVIFVTQTLLFTKGVKTLRTINKFIKETSHKTCLACAGGGKFPSNIAEKTVDAANKNSNKFYFKAKAGGGSAVKNSGTNLFDKLHSLSNAEFSKLVDQGKIVFEHIKKHNSNSQGRIGKPPTNPDIFKTSIKIKSTSHRRVAVDRNNGEIVIFDLSAKGGSNIPTFHGHIRPWKPRFPSDNVVPNDIKTFLRKRGLVNEKGKIR